MHALVISTYLLQYTLALNVRASFVCNVRSKYLNREANVPQLHADKKKQIFCKISNPFLISNWQTYTKWTRIRYVNHVTSGSTNGRDTAPLKSTSLIIKTLFVPYLPFNMLPNLIIVEAILPVQLIVREIDVEKAVNFNWMQIEETK